MPTIKVAPNSLSSAIIEHLTKATARGDTKTMNECVSVLATHFSRGTTLGDVVSLRRDLQEALGETQDEEEGRRLLERARVGLARTSPAILGRAFAAAFRDANKIKDFGPKLLKESEYDDVFGAWVNGELRASLDAESRLLESAIRRPDDASRSTHSTQGSDDGKGEGSGLQSESAEVDASEMPTEMVPLVLKRAKTLLRETAQEQFTDPRQRDLLTSWANSLDSVKFEKKAKGYLKEVYGNITSGSKALREAGQREAAQGSADSGLESQILEEVRSLCENLLTKRQDWDSASTLSNVLLVLEVESALKS